MDDTAACCQGLRSPLERLVGAGSAVSRLSPRESTLQSSEAALLRNIRDPTLAAARVHDGFVLERR